MKVTCYRISRALAAAVLLCQCSPNDSTKEEPSGIYNVDDRPRVSRTFTSQEDWAEGTFEGINNDSAGQIQMASGLQLYETPFIWIPNSKERSVSKVDTKTRTLIDTYPLVDGDGRECWNPSRTTVDIEGNVWVGCRGTSSYINRDQLGNRSIPDEVDFKVMKLAKDDGSVLLSIDVGYAPRALAIDANNHVWIGCSVDDTVWEIDGDTGACYRGEGAGCAESQVDVDDFPYGAAVDQRGHLWVVQNRIPTRDKDLVTEIDTESGEVLGVYGPFTGKGKFEGANSRDRGGCDDLYGIAIDQMNDIWLGGFSCDDVVKLKGVSGPYHADGQTYEAGEMIAAFDAAGTLARGIAVDLDGNVWVAMYRTSTGCKINNVSGAIMQTLNVGAGPIGVGVDAFGNAWVVSQDADSVHWVNGLRASESLQIDVGEGPYTYSDMLGMALRTITHRADGFAHWQVDIDSGVADPVWESVHWNANEPNQTDLRVRIRCAATEADLLVAPWSEFVDQPGPLSCAAGSGGRYAQIEVRFYATGTTSSPVLYDLTVYWKE